MADASYCPQRTPYPPRVASVGKSPPSRPLDLHLQFLSSERQPGEPHCETNDTSASALQSPPTPAGSVPFLQNFLNASPRYDAGVESVQLQSRSISRTKSVFGRVKSLGDRARNRRSAYARLEDGQSGAKWPSSGVRQDEQYDPGNGLDLSALDGSNAPWDRSPGGPRRISASKSGNGQALAADFNRFEAQGTLTGGLGAGLDKLSSSSAGHDQPMMIGSAKQTAEKTGEIVVVEDPTVDLGTLTGVPGGPHALECGGQEAIKEKSFYFPEDPEMPNWKPFPMHAAYTSVLVVLAMFLAGLQEYLCQRSKKLALEGTGLIEFTSVQDVSLRTYFAWRYAPTMILLAYGILWQTTDFEVKRLEPYYQLSRPSGALAAESLNMDYLTFWSLLAPLKAFRHRQWAVVCSAVGYLLAGGLVPVLQSASVVLLPDRAQQQDDQPKFVRIQPTWSRLMEAVLVLIAICGVLLLFQLRRRSGLLSDPKGIAGVAAMATRSHILNDFQNLDLENHSVIHDKLQHRRYVLHKSSLWQGQYIGNTNTVHHYEIRKPDNPHLLMLTLKAGIPYILFIICFAVLLPIIMFTNANVVTEKVPFFLTALASVIKLVWATLECDIRMLEPFYILSKRRAPPRTLTLDYTGTVPGWIVIKSLLNKHFLVSLVSIGALLAELLIVCAASFSIEGKRFFPGSNSQQNNVSDSDETFRRFWAAFGLSLGILMYLVVVACLAYTQRRHKFLPRPPGTISSVLGYIHQSKMLWDFVNTECMDGRQMTAWLEGLRKDDNSDAAGPTSANGGTASPVTEPDGGAYGEQGGKGRATAEGKTYGLGWFRGRDGEDHLGVDEEPLIAGYRHGADWRLGRLASAGGINSWETY